MKNKIFIIAICVFMISGIEVSAQRTIKVKKSVARRTQNIQVNLTERGYEPESFKLKKSIPARITFIRKTEDECGSEIVIPAYNIRRELPLNKPVTISLTPRRAGNFSFTCGMDMMRGKIIVQ